MAIIFGVLFIAAVVFVVFIGVSLIYDALNSCIRVADALDRIANALEADEETGGADDES